MTNLSKLNPSLLDNENQTKQYTQDTREPHCGDQIKDNTEVKIKLPKLTRIKHHNKMNRPNHNKHNIQTSLK